MWLKLKGFLFAIPAFALAILAAMFYRQKANHEQEKRKAVEHSNEVERTANQAMIDGMDHELGIKDSYEQTNHIKRTDLD